MMPRVWNRREPGVPMDAVYVGRPSKWGNPYTHLKTHSLAEIVVATKNEAIAAYEAWLLDNPALLASVKTELAGKDLVCWCAPRPCHADVLLRIANTPTR